MISARFTSSGRVLATLVLTFAMFVALAPPASALLYTNWKSAVSGMADDATKWDSGVPGSDSQASFPWIGTYSVTFPGTVPATHDLIFTAGNVTSSFTSTHTTNSVMVASATTAVATCEQGALNMQWLQVGGFGGNNTLTLTRTTIGGAYADFSSQAVFHSPASGDFVGQYGNGTMNIFGGAQFRSGDAGNGSGTNWGFNIAPTAGIAGTVAVAGFNAFTFTNSRLSTLGANDLNVGVNGTGTLGITNRGIVDASNDLFVGQLGGSFGTLNVGPSTGGACQLIVRNNLGIGTNHFASTSGIGVMSVTGNASVNVVGRVDVGNPNGNPASVLLMGQGATFRVGNGLRVNNASSWLDLRGGILNIRGGAFTWPTNRQLVISSQVGTPELWLGNGVQNFGPSIPGLAPQLSIGRGGSGTLRVTQPGTIYWLGNGPTILGDSLGGNGKIVVDSLGQVATTAYTSIGNFGTGELDVLGGGYYNMRAVYVGRQTPTGGAGGTLIVRGAGSLVTAQDLFEIGSPSGDYGTGKVMVDSGATLVLGTTSPGFDPSFTIRAKSGLVTVGTGSRLESVGGVSLFGNLELNGGQFITTYNSIGTASLIRGWGQINGPVWGYGRIEPYAAADSFGCIRMNNSLQLEFQSHYVVSLGTGPGPRCDTLAVTGAATMFGVLDLRTDGSFIRNAGDVYTILTCGSRSGTFNAVTWNGAPLTGQANIVYNANSIQVVITSGTVGVEPTVENGVSELRFAAAGSPSAPAVLLDLPMAAEVDVRLYDITGRVAARLFEGPLAAGQHRFELRGGAVGAPLASGAYFARATVRSSGGATAIQRTVRTTVLR